MNLAYAVSGNARRKGSNLTRLQKGALDNLQSMTPFNPRTQEPGNYAIIQRWFIISDELLFFKSLENYCTLEAIVPEDDHSRRGSRRFEHFSFGPFNYTPDNVRCTLFIYRHHNDPHDPTERLDRYLGALLLEMVHAVLRIYSCRCRLEC
jgi:hypothetical protein